MPKTCNTPKTSGRSPKKETNYYSQKYPSFYSPTYYTADNNVINSQSGAVNWDHGNGPQKMANNQSTITTATDLHRFGIVTILMVILVIILGSFYIRLFSKSSTEMKRMEKSDKKGANLSLTNNNNSKKKKEKKVVHKMDNKASLNISTKDKDKDKNKSQSIKEFLQKILTWSTYAKKITTKKEKANQNKKCIQAVGYNNNNNNNNNKSNNNNNKSASTSNLLSSMKQ
ncbi:bromodomain-containing protein, partial [Reticulomyxa filosa]